MTMRILCPRKQIIPNPNLISLIANCLPTQKKNGENGKKTAETEFKLNISWLSVEVVLSHWQSDKNKK